MRINFLLGRAAADIDSIIYGQIAEALKKDALAPIILVVPPQATYSTEVSLIEKVGAPGIMGASVVSFMKLADRALREVRGAGSEALDTAGKCMVLRRLITEHAPRLTALQKCAQKGSLAEELADLISELKSHDITPDMLQGFETASADSARRFADIALLYAAFEAETANLYDTEDRLNFVIEQIPDAQFIRDAHVFIHGYDMYSAQMERFVKAIMRTAKKTTVSFLHAGSGDADADVYRLCNFNHEKFVPLAKELGLETTFVREERNISQDILHISQNLYAYPAKSRPQAKDISITRAADLEEEVRAVAAQIAYLVQNRGYRFGEMGIVCGDVNAYAPTLKKVFGKANIPLFTGEKRPLSGSALGTFLLTALDIAGGRLKKDQLIAHAKTGFLGLDAKETSCLQNYVYENVSDGFAFLKPFGQDIAELARVKLMDPVSILREAFKHAKTARQMVGALLSYMQVLHVTDKLEKNAEQMQQAGLLGEAAFSQAAAQGALALLSQAAYIFGDCELTRPQLKKALLEGLRAHKIATIPPGADEVTAGDISYIRLPGVRALFVLGANEGTLPDYGQQADLLTPHEREEILGGLAHLRYGGAMEKQRLAILRAFSAPRQKLFLSHTAEGGAQPSPLIGRLRELFSSVRENDAKDLMPMLRENAFYTAALALRQHREEGARQTANAVLTGANSPRARMVHELATSKNETRLSAKNADVLFADIKGSASRVETFYSCPYKHFMAYGVRPQLLREHTINQLDVGLYAHEILDSVSKQVLSMDTDFAQIGQETLDAVLAQATAAAQQSRAKYSLSGSNKAVLSAVDREIALAVSSIRAQAQQGALRTALTEYHFEQSFGGLTVGGYIDRIDTANHNGKDYFSIVDYKTGNMEFDIKKALGGLSLQLMIYILAARQLMQDAEFAGALYFKVRLPSFAEDTSLEDAFKMNGILSVPPDAAQDLYGQAEGGLYSLGVKITKDGAYSKLSQNQLYSRDELETLLAYTGQMLQNAAQKIKGGEISLRPAQIDGRQETACTYCDYTSICMFDGAYAENSVRLVPAAGKAQALEHMQEGLE